MRWSIQDFVYGATDGAVTMDRLAREGNLFRSFCGPPNSASAELLSKLNWYNGTCFVKVIIIDTVQRLAETKELNRKNN